MEINVSKALFLGLRSHNSLFSTENLGRFNPSQGLGAASKPLFSVKRFSAQAFAGNCSYSKAWATGGGEA